MADALLAAVAVAAGVLASMTGFGIGSLLTPMVSLRVPLKIAVAAVSVPHVVGTAVRFWMLRAHVDRRVLLTFGLASAAGGLTGALLQSRLGSPVLSGVFGALLLFVAATQFTGAADRMRFGGAVAMLAGALSGLLGGLVGNQGGIRSAGLMGFDMSKESFVATATAIGLMVDAARMPVYAATEGPVLTQLAAPIAIMVAGVGGGTIAGTWLLARVPQRRFRPSSLSCWPCSAWRWCCRRSDENSVVPDIDRRSLLKLAALTPLTGLGRPAAPAASQATPEQATHTLRIATGLIELSPDHILSTTLYNDQFPGPLLRFTEGERIVVDLQNDTDVPEQVHWHGQFLPTDVDGAAEQGTPFVPAHGTRRISFVPRPAGFRFVHTHVMAGPDLARGTYTGQVCPVYVQPKLNAGAYDREVFIVLKEFAPSWSRGGDMAVDMLTGAPVAELKAMGKANDDRYKGPKGFEVGYELFSINGRMRGHGEPIRVKHGERVLFHVLNASATEIRSLALPGHTFRVIALDGNPVPTPATVPLLWLGTAERVSAIVEMTHPGVWLMGDLADDDRRHGMGIVVEYAARKGPAVWTPPSHPFRWDYARFGHPVAAPASPGRTIAITVAKENGAVGGFNRWTLNGDAFSHDAMTPLYTVHTGERVRIRFRNASDDVHPLHLHRHSFELTRVGGKETSGVMKDVVMLGGFQELEFDFVADNPGRTLFHCHQQLHMDYGFMALFDYA